MTLQSLPAELLENIVLTLANPGPPSLSTLHERPSNSLLFSSQQPLKNLSLTCRTIHHRVCHHLRSFLRANIDDTPKLVDFVRRKNIDGHIGSLVLYSKSATQWRTARCTGPLSGNLTLPALTDTTIWPFVVHVLDALDPESLILVLSSRMLEDVLPYKLKRDDEWAFGHPFHSLHLEHPPQPRRKPPYNHFHDRRILSLRRWTKISYNQGSSIPAYSTYEYFHKRTPSMLAPGSAISPSGFGDIFSNLLENLTSFDFIAIFPFGFRSTHISWLKLLPNLRDLRVQFAPSLNDRILDDPIALGTTARSDLWKEFEWAYESVAIALSNTWLLRLEDFTSLDYRNHGLREMIVASLVAISEQWVHDGQGRWISSRLRKDSAQTG